MPPDPLLTTAGWSLDGLITKGHRFRKIPRVSVSDKNLDATIRKHESSGLPLVVEGMYEHQAWPTTMFDIQWLRDNLKQQIQVRNVRNRRDLDVSFAEFLEHIKSIHRYASTDETSRWYAKDMECPREWKEWLNTTTSPVPRELCPHGAADIMQNLPEQARVETLMCYLGIGDTFTPCHKDLCASFGHNLMCYAEDGASAFWFMTEGSVAPLMANYFQSLDQELDLESHAMSVEEFAGAPCDVYITEQKAGDLVLVPPRSCHQVVNHSGLTVKMSWSRMTIRSTQIALHHELPIYRRVCRAETYRIKSTIHHTLRRKTGLLEEIGGKDSVPSYHDIFRIQLASDVQKLLELFREVILEECYPNAKTLDHVILDFNHNVYDAEGYPAFSCDFCGSDIFVSFFCCKRCSPSAKNPSGIGDGLHICPGCCAEGRSCGCGGPMEPVQCWPSQILYGDYNRAVRALKVVGVDVFDEIVDCEILNNNMTGVFKAGIAIQKWRAEIDKGGSLCYATAQPHAVHNAAILHCKKCRKGHCFVHLAEAGIHSSEAITLYENSLEQSTWHEFHLSKRTSASDRETILAVEASGDDVSNMIGQKRAMVALSFSHCQPVNNISYIKLGWYDKPKSTGVATLGSSYAMDMSFPRDGEDWGSPLTDICPEDSISNTLVGSETPSREPERAKSRSSGPVAVQCSTDMAVDSMKRKRPSVVFDGVAPPERRRKKSARCSESPPSAALPRSVTSVRGNEKNLGPQSTRLSTAALESTHLQKMIETLTATVAEQNRNMDKLVQDNADLRNGIRNLSQTLQTQHKKIDVSVQNNTRLRDEIWNLSRTVQSSKGDVQRIENISTRMAAELKGKFEDMSEKSENRILGSVNRLLEELERIRSNPLTSDPPVPVPSSTAFPSTVPYPPEPLGGDGEWTFRDDYTPTGSNKPHYQGSWDKFKQPHHKYSRGGYRPNRGRGRGLRGGYSGNRPPNQKHYALSNSEGWGQPYCDQAMPSAPVAAPKPVSMPIVPPVSDSYHSRGCPPLQSPHTSSSSHSYPHATSSPTTHPRPYSHTHGNANTNLHPHTAPPTLSPVQAMAALSSSSQHASYRHAAAHPPVYEHEHESKHTRPRDHHQTHHQPPPPLHEWGKTHAPHAADDKYGEPRYNHTQPHQPPPPRSHEWGQTHTQAPAPASAPQAADDDGGYGKMRHVDPTYTVRSPTPSDCDEQVRCTPTPSDSTSLAAGGQLRRHHDSQSRASSPSRGYGGHGHGHGHADEVRRGGWH